VLCTETRSEIHAPLSLRVRHRKARDQARAPEHPGPLSWPAELSGHEESPPEVLRGAKRVRTGGSLGFLVGDPERRQAGDLGAVLGRIEPPRILHTLGARWRPLSLPPCLPRSWWPSMSASPPSKARPRRSSSILTCAGRGSFHPLCRARPPLLRVRLTVDRPGFASLRLGRPLRLLG
jgi:hypothetical protein